MADIQIEVTIYEGYRGAERPSSLMFEGNSVTVVRLLRTWVEEEHKTRKQKRFFTLQGSDRYEYTLYYDIDLSEWFLRSREQSVSSIK
jgi:hypothetical protein